MSARSSERPVLMLERMHWVLKIPWVGGLACGEENEKREEARSKKRTRTMQAADKRMAELAPVADADPAGEGDDATALAESTAAADASTSPSSSTSMGRNSRKQHTAPQRTRNYAPAGLRRIGGFGARNGRTRQTRSCGRS